MPVMPMVMSVMPMMVPVMPMIMPMMPVMMLAMAIAEPGRMLPFIHSPAIAAIAGIRVSQWCHKSQCGGHYKHNNFTFANHATLPICMSLKVRQQ